MGRQTTIRWDRAARLGGAGVVVVATVIVAPSLLKPGEPPPLDPDIGLVPTDAPPLTAASPPVQRSTPASRGAGHERRDRGDAGRPTDRRPHHPQARPNPRQERGQARAPVRAAAMLPTPSSASATTVTYGIAPAAAPADGTQRSPGASEFGFER